MWWKKLVDIVVILAFMALTLFLIKEAYCPVKQLLGIPSSFCTQK